MDKKFAGRRGLLSVLFGSLIVFLPVASSYAAAVYIPATIAGEAQQDRVGTPGTIALSGDGTTVSIAGSQTENVRIFSWNGSALSQKGSTISDGETGSGRVVDLDDAGDSVAVGEKHSDLAGINDGTVRVYDFDGAAWTIRGNPVNGVAGTPEQDIFGGAVSIAGDGDSFVASGFGSSSCSGSGGAKGSMKVFEWSGGSWSQKGATIEGESCSVQLATGGYQVEISDDGEVIATTTESDTRIYGWDSGTSAWAQLGSSIGHTGAISLSDDGTRIAIGVTGVASDYARIYEYSSGSWSLMGSQITLDVASGYAADVSLNSAGDAVVIGNPSASPRGEVSVLDWDGSAWAARFSAMQGSTSVGYINLGSAVAISEDGKITAASDYRYDTYRGIVRLNAVGAFSLTYDLNSGDSGLPSTQEGDFGSSLTISATEPSRSGYDFAGWSTSPDGGLAYSGGDPFTVPLANTTLYARWQLRPTASANEASTGAQGSVSNPGLQKLGPTPPASPESRLTRQRSDVAEKPVVLPSSAGTSSSARASVAGELIEVAVSNSATGAKIFDIGGVQLGLQAMSQSRGVDNPAEAGFSLIAEEKLDLSVGGLEPRSLVQVFFPLENGRFLSLVNLPSNASGEVLLEIDSAQLDDTFPIPIGSHSIQIVAINADGDEIVIEVPFAVGQPDPQSNVPDWSLDDENPGPGLAETLVNGLPISSTTYESSSGFGLQGENWEISFDTSPPDGATSNYQLEPDGGFDGNIAGFKAETRVDVWLYSTPVLLASANVSSDGTAKLALKLEGTSVTPGLHTLQVQGVNLDGYIQTSNLTIEIVSSGGESGTNEIEATSSPGFQTVWLAAALILTAILGMVALILVFRRLRG